MKKRKGEGEGEKEREKERRRKKNANQSENSARIRPTQRVVRVHRVTGHRRLFVSFRFVFHGSRGGGGERKPLETGNSNETNVLSGRLTRTNFVWNRFEDRTSKVFHHPLPLSPPPPVFSLPFVCIFVDKGACIINEASLEEPLVERIAA